MRKVLIPIIAALLAFFMLSNSVSASFVQYYAARFSGSANGWCWIFTEMPVNQSAMPSAYGKGRLDIRGLAIVRKDTGPPFGDYYWANTTQDSNTNIWTYRTQMRVTWGSNICAVHMWTPDTVWGIFIDDGDYFIIANMSFAGWYKEDTAPLQFIRGIANVYLLFAGPPGEEILVAEVILFIGPEHFRTFAWVTEEIEGYPTGYLARSISHRVTVWPIEWRAIVIG